MRRARMMLLVLGLLLAGTAARASAQPTQPSGLAPAEPGADLRIYLMTLSPGSIIYERFGHNTIVVHDPNPTPERVEQRGQLDSAYYAKYSQYPPRGVNLLPTDRA